MKGKLYKIYDHGKLLVKPELIDEVDVYNHQLYNVVYAATSDNQTFIMQDAQIYLIEPSGIRIRGVEKINGIYYKQDWFLQT